MIALHCEVVISCPLESLSLTEQAAGGEEINVTITSHSPFFT